MQIFRPTVVKKSITEVSVALLDALQVSVVLLDVDNTLVSYRSHEPTAEALAWTKQMAEVGYRLMIVSNNYEKRVAPIAAKFQLPYTTFAMKPLPFGYLRAKHRFHAAARDCVIIGDQVFTDVLGANFTGMKSILLSPIEMESSRSFIWRRAWEEKYRREYREEVLDDDNPH